MKTVNRALGLMSVLLVLTLAAGARGAEGDAPKRGGGRLNPDTIEKALTGDLALTADQKTKVTESYDKTVKPIREKITAAADAEAKKAIYPEMKTANEAFKAALKTILKDEQYKIVEGLSGKPKPQP